MTLSLPAYVIACDFDGTAAADDVGNELFRTFAGPGWLEATALWKAGKISSRDCLVRECAAATASDERLHRFIDARQLDPTFVSFYRTVQAAGWPLIIVSDGMSYYIERIFERAGVTGIPVFSNTLVRQGPRFTPVFPYHHYGCGRCGNCKKHHLDRWRDKGSRLVYIGDGLSDRCAAAQADLVFAKKDLADHCREKGISFVEFCDFDEIIKHLKRACVPKRQENVDKLTK